MIRSMTAYAWREIKGNWGRASWEMRSVNQRYLEINIHIPEQFHSLEPIIHKRIRASLTRGKIECSLQFWPNASAPEELALNEKLVEKLINAANWLKIRTNGDKINPVDILRWPGVMMPDKQDLDLATTEILGAIDITLDDFIKAREVEGLTLKAILEQRLESMSIEVAKIRTHMPAILQWQRKRLVTKLEDAQIQLENNRLEQELVLIAHRLDITEELDRLETHIKEIHNILKKKNTIGRHLDFMMQELNRESNTLASKSINTEVTNAAIELKVLIEQMREQIQNIE